MCISIGSVKGMQTVDQLTASGVAFNTQLVSRKLPAFQPPNKTLRCMLLQMGALMRTAASWARRCSVCGSSCTAHAAVRLCASSAWRTCTTMQQSGTATEAAAAAAAAATVGLWKTSIAPAKGPKKLQGEQSCLISCQQNTT